MGWTASEQLITIFDDGTMDVHSVQGEKIFNRLLTRVSSVKALCTGVYCLLSANRPNIV